jgi:asparagine synthase (glutamine-hydrolysing)
VPREIWRRPKKGFGVPLGQWFRGPLREMLVESLGELDGIVDRTVVSQYVDEHSRGKRDRRKELFNLLALALWYRRARSIASTEARHHLA